MFTASGTVTVYERPYVSLVKRELYSISLLKIKTSRGKNTLALIILTQNC